MVRPGGALLIGQDVREGMEHRIQDKWQEIITALGYLPRRVGAQDSAEVRAELQARGLPVEVLTVATWTMQDAPRAALESVVLREWSKTWAVPDDLFAESARQLTDWAEQEYGDRLDVPQPGRYSFTLAVVRKE